MLFLIVTFAFIFFGTIRGMEPDLPDQRPKPYQWPEVEIVLNRVKNDTSGPIYINENKQVITLQQGQTWQYNKKLILLTQKELIKMNPKVITEVNGNAAFFDSKTSKIWQYNDIVTIREKKEQLALTEDEKRTLDYENHAFREKNPKEKAKLNLVYGDSSFHEQFLHFTNDAKNRICFKVCKETQSGQYADIGTSFLTLSKDGNTDFNKQDNKSDRQESLFFTQLHTNFDIILEGDNLEKSHIKQRELYSLYDLCFISLMKSMKKEKLRELINPNAPIAPKIKEHITFVLSGKPIAF